MTQQELSLPERAKTDAIAQVEANNREWIDIAYYHLASVVLDQPTLTALDIWEAIEHCDPCDVMQPTNPRAMGPVFMRAKHAGLISPTNQFVKSGRVSDHNQMLRVWKSEVYRG